jgi:beta-glucosidase
VFGEVAELSNAVIESFNGGDMAGLAVAQLIRGDFCPSGRLSISFPYSSCALPCYYNQYSGWHGGKYMDMPAGNAYVFGYGLSYTNFEYSNLHTDQMTYQKDGCINISVDVKNAGKVDAKEVVQLYVHDTVSTILTPVKQLKGFEKVEIKAGETKKVALKLPVSELGFYKEDGFVIEPGQFEIMVGKNSEDYLTTTITVE